MVVLSVVNDETKLAQAIKDAIGGDVMSISQTSFVPEVTKPFSYPVWVVDIGLPQALASIEKMGNAAVIAVTHESVTTDTAVFLIGKAVRLIVNPTVEKIVSEVLKHATQFTMNGYKLDAKEKRIWHDGVEFDLTLTRFEILLHIVKRNGRVTNYQEIAKDIYNENLTQSEAISRLKTHIYYLRKDLEAVSGHDPIVTRGGHVLWVSKQ